MAARDNLPLLDDAILTELAGGSGDEIVRVLVEGFLEEAEERVAAILRAKQDRDSDAVSFQAHALKSTSATYGATRMQELAARLETAAKTQECAAIDTEIAQIDSMWRATDKAFRHRFLH